MSRLSKTQLKFMVEAQEALENREIVILRGKPDGKTRIVYELQEAIAMTDKNGVIRTTRRHAENSELEFINTISWPRSDKLSEIAIMRQIVCAKHTEALDPEGWKRWRFAGGQDICDEYRNILVEYRKQQRILVVAIDNAELLSKGCFTIMKALNEMRDTRIRRNIGVAFLLAGEYDALKADYMFYKRTKEIRIAKINAAETTSILQYHYPTEVNRFNDSAVERLSRLDCTLDVIAVARTATMMRKENRRTTIDEALIRAAIATLPKPKEKNKAQGAQAKAKAALAREEAFA